MVLFGRNNWGNKGSAGALPIHWRMGRLDGTDGVMVPLVTGQCFVSLIFVAARQEMCWKIEKISPGVISKNCFYEVLCSEGSLVGWLVDCAGEAAVILFRVFLSFSWVRGHSLAGKLLYLSFSYKSVSQAWLGRFCSQMCYHGWVLIPKGALVTAALPWVSAGGAWGLSWSLLTGRSSGGSHGWWGALEPSALCF